MATETKRDLIKEGEQDYQRWRATLVDTPEKKALYEEIAVKSDQFENLARLEPSEEGSL
ncbi:MAG: hypothetical protein Q7R39_07530 [Dehalococcoidia bacterium]|nr:hypothetical protein [Dehalococcoidia bacterium]